MPESTIQIQNIALVFTANTVLIGLMFFVLKEFWPRYISRLKSSPHAKYGAALELYRNVHVAHFIDKAENFLMTIAVVTLVMAISLNLAAMFWPATFIFVLGQEALADDLFVSSILSLISLGLFLMAVPLIGIFHFAEVVRIAIGRRNALGEYVESDSLSDIEETQCRTYAKS